jgi:hypothetical protein
MNLFNPINQQHKQFVANQTKKLQHAVQRVIHLGTKTI